MHSLPRKLIIAVLILSIVAPAVLFGAPKKADAFFGCTTTPTTTINPLAVPTQDIGNLVQNTVTAMSTLGNLSKECILDAIVTILGKAIISNVTRSIVEWINTGFEGSPSFVTNPEGFLTGVADEAAGAFIEKHLGGIGQLLCSPFDLRLRLALNLNYSSNYKDRIGCRLTDIQKNVYGAFVGGSFVGGGGWNSWIAVTSVPQNNIFGAYFETSDLLNTELTRKVNSALQELSWGRGFLSFKGKDGTIKTPGALIQDQLSQTLGTDLRQLELADEINEIIGALVNVALKQVFSSNGLLGTSKTYAGSTSSYWEGRDFGSYQRNFDEYLRTAKNDDTQGATTTDFVATGQNASGVAGAGTAAANAAENGTVYGGGAGQTPQRHNIALGKSAVQSSEYAEKIADNAPPIPHPASFAVDGTPSSSAITNADANAFWQVNLGENSNGNQYTVLSVEEIRIAKQAGAEHQTDTLSLFISDRPFNQLVTPQTNSMPWGTLHTLAAQGRIREYHVPTNAENSDNPVIVPIAAGERGQYIRIQRPSNSTQLRLPEVTVLGKDCQGSNCPSGTVTPGGSNTGDVTGGVTSPSDQITLTGPSGGATIPLTITGDGAAPETRSAHFELTATPSQSFTAGITEEFVFHAPQNLGQGNWTIANPFEFIRMRILDAHTREEFMRVDIITEGAPAQITSQTQYQSTNYTKSFDYAFAKDNPVILSFDATLRNPAEQALAPTGSDFEILTAIKNAAGAVLQNSSVHLRKE